MLIEYLRDEPPLQTFFDVLTNTLVGMGRDKGTDTKNVCKKRLSIERLETRKFLLYVSWFPRLLLCSLNIPHV